MKTVCNFDEALRHVNSITDGLGHPVDQKIRSLVAVLYMLGVKTTGSCEGHIGWGRPYPWISAPCTSATKLCKYTTRQNRPTRDDGTENLNRWVILPAGPELFLVPWDIKRPLEELQRDAKEFAERLRRRASL